MNAADYITRLGAADAWGFARHPALPGHILVVVFSALALLNPHLRQRLSCAYALLLYPWLLILAYSFIGSFQGHNWEFYSGRFFMLASAAIGFLTVTSLLAARRPASPGLRLGAAAAILLLVAAYGALRTTDLVRELTTTDTAYWNGARYDTWPRPGQLRSPVVVKYPAAR